MQLLSTVSDLLIDVFVLALVSRLPENKSSYVCVVFTVNLFAFNTLKELSVHSFALNPRHASKACVESKPLWPLFKTFMKRQLHQLVYTFYGEY